MSQPVKLAVASTRQSTAFIIDAKRREAKSCITKLAVANASSVSVASSKQLKPVMTAKIDSLKCKYCDKTFMKTHGMKTHLLEKCEKIPATVRRQLLQKEDISKQSSRQAFRPEIDNVSIYSRFFVNEGASGMQGVDVEEGLKNLRVELRKKSAHTGIIRTPRKFLRCHICKQVFIDCVEYAVHFSNHTLT